MLFGEINAAVTLMEKLTIWLVKLCNSKKISKNTSVTGRFIHLFEAHGIHRNQIPRFFGHGILLKDLENEQSLLAKLDEIVLEAVCRLFSIRREWLDGVDDQVYPVHDFYKRPHDFVNFIEELMQGSCNGTLSGYLIAPNKIDQNCEAILLFQEDIGTVGDKHIYRYYLCNNWLFCYWKSRAYLAACVAASWKRNIYVQGLYADRKLIDQLFNGRSFMTKNGECIFPQKFKRWHAEDMALEPQTYLHHVAPEAAQYGLTKALQLWLDLDNQGLMDVGLNIKARPVFQSQLKKYEFELIK